VNGISIIALKLANILLNSA